MMAAAGLALALGLARVSDAAAAPPPPEAAKVDRERVESEATLQGTEADRLYKAGDYAAALPLFEAERASRAALGDLRYEAFALRGAGCCRYGLGDDDGAVAAWRAALAVDAQRLDKAFEGYDGLLIGRSYLRRGRHEEAAAALLAAIPLLSKAIDRDHETDARLAMTETLLARGLASEAVPHAERAEALALALKDPKRMAWARHASAQVSLALGKPEAAAKAAEEARRGFEASGDGSRSDSASASHTLGKAFLALRMFDDASAAFERAATDHSALKEWVGAAEDLTALAGAELDAGDIPGASSAARRASDASRLADDPGGRGRRPGASSPLSGPRRELARRRRFPHRRAAVGPPPRPRPAKLVRLLLLDRRRLPPRLPSPSRRSLTRRSRARGHAGRQRGTQAAGERGESGFAMRNRPVASLVGGRRSTRRRVHGPGLGPGRFHDLIPTDLLEFVPAVEPAPRAPSQRERRPRRQ